MDSDKVLVMDAGQAVEFNHPHILLQNPDGKFTSMVKETGANMEHRLRETAANAYQHHIAYIDETNEEKQPTSQEKLA